jgi:hypothetical protein
LKRAIAAYAEFFPQWIMNNGGESFVRAERERSRLRILPLFCAPPLSRISRRIRIGDANSQLIGIYLEDRREGRRAESISVLCAEAKVDGTEKGPKPMPGPR